MNKPYTVQNHLVDLHTHSTASDGLYSPTELINLAVKESLSGIALTDHDTINGITEAKTAADLAQINFVAGIEIEIAFMPGEFHLLGLDLQKPFGSLYDATKQLAESRTERNKEIIKKLNDDGFDVTFSELTELAGKSSIGRPHIAELLVKKKLVRNKQDAFDKYLAKGKPYYIPKACLDLPIAIKLIHEAGGLAFVAHPMSLFVSWTKLRTFFSSWKELGIDGIEAYHPCARLVECKRLDILAKEFNFKVSAGSDYHGDNRPDRRLGYTVNKMPISEDYLNILKR